MPSKTQWGIILVASLYGFAQPDNFAASLGSATFFFLFFLFIAATYNGTITAKLKQWRANWGKPN